MSEVAGIIDWPAELERLAFEAEKEALKVADDKFAEFAAEHERQTAGYRFECRRWGDFLSVFIERQGNLDTEWRKAERKISTSLNIGGTKQIKLVHGHCFDRRGEVSYRANMQKDGEEFGSAWGTGFGRCAPSKGWHYRVWPSYPCYPSSRKMVEADPKPGKDFGGIRMDADDYQPRHTTKDYPRPAKDDRIYFEGIGMTIYAPAGMGRQVYDAIMAEIASVDTLPKGQDRETGLGAEQG